MTETVTLPWRGIIQRIENADDNIFVYEKSVIISDPQLVKLVQTRSQTDQPFLLAGELGTGKKVITKLIHDRSPRKAFQYDDANMKEDQDFLDTTYFGTESIPPPLASFNKGTVHVDILENLVNLPPWYAQNILNLIQKQPFRQRDGKSLSLDIRVIGGTLFSLEAFHSHARNKEHTLHLYTALLKGGEQELLPLRKIVSDRAGLIRVLAEQLAACRLYRNYSEDEITRLQDVNSSVLDQLAKFTWPDNFNELPRLLESARNSSWEGAITNHRVHLSEGIVAPSVPVKKFAHDVFLSYAAKDDIVARKVEAQLKKAGLIVYLYSKNIVPGEIWDDALRRALLDSAEMCFIATPKSIKSQWVIMELAIAWSRDLPITPLFAGCTVNDIPEHFKKWTGVDISDIGQYVQAVIKRKAGK